MEEVVACLRSCLTSTKQRCNIRQLRSDYKMIMGCDIPFRQFKFATLEDFLKSIPTIRYTCVNGEIFVEAKVTENSKDIQALVSKQKNSKKKMKISLSKPSQYNRYGSYNINKFSTEKWTPNKGSYQNRQQHYQQSSIPAAVRHNQFVNPPKPIVQSRSPPPKSVSPIQRPENTAKKYNSTGNRVDAQKRLEVKTKQVNTSPKQVNTSPKQVNTSSKQVNTTPKQVNTSPKQVNTSPKQVQFSNNVNPENFNGATLSRSKYVQKDDNNSPEPQMNGKSILKKPELILGSFASDTSVIETHRRTDIPFFRTGDNINDLLVFTKQNSLPEPYYNVLARTEKPMKRVLYDCCLKVGDESYISYPNEFFSKAEVKQFVSNMALADLTVKCRKNRQLLISDDEDILMRIPPIIMTHPMGIWNTQLEEDYVDKFNEKLPSNWLEIIDISPFISVEPLASQFVLRYCKSGEILQKSTIDPDPLSYEVSIPSNTINFSKGDLIAEITCITSAKEIWCRQLATPEAESFVQMSLYLNNTYSSPYMTEPEELYANKIITGGYYIANYDNSFIRVRVLEVFDEDVNCFQVDFGDECTVSKKDIFNIKREFARDQAQAFICRLAGLEDLYEVSSQSEMLQGLIGQQFHVEAASDESFLVPNDPVISVVMYNTETNACLNKELISHLTIESATQVLHEDRVNEVVVRNKEDNGDIYVQIMSPGLQQLENLIYELQNKIAENPSLAQPIPYNKLSQDKLYFAKYNVDEEFYRAKIIDFSPCRKFAQIYFVDFGNTQVLKLKEEPLIAIEEISDIVNQFPPQVIRVRISLDAIPPDFVSKFSKLVPEDKPIMLRIVKNSNEEGLPLVDLYRRSEPDGILFSINRNIAPLTHEANGDTNNNTHKPSQKIQRLMSLNQFDDLKNVPSSGLLKCPEVGKVGDDFDVTVPHAVSPWNFFVQPFNQHEKLADLQKKLKQRYEQEMSPLKIDDIQAGKIYASKHVDGHWYRTSVLKIIGPGSISVCFCDFGYYSNVSVSQLFPLSKEFMDLPYQAIKARLHGLEPSKSKWTLEDCSYFQKLVTGKNFVSNIKGMEKDELYKSDTVLNLKLIDTSTSKTIDYNVAQMMIDENRAIKK